MEAQQDKAETAILKPKTLPIGWEWKTVADIADVTMGQSPSSEYYNTVGEGLPFFQGKAEFGDLYPSPAKWCTQPNKIAQKDDILISVRAPVGPTNFAPKECCIGRGLAAIKPRNRIPPKYVLLYLRSIETKIDSLGTGTTFRAISGGILRDLPIPLPPLHMQKRIVAEIEKQFSRLDEAVTNLKRVKANLKRYRASVLKAAVEGRLVETEAEVARREGREYETGKQLLERILETRRREWKGKGQYKEPSAPDVSELPELPEGWAWGTVEQISERVTKGSSPNWQGFEYCHEGIPFVRSQNVGWGHLDLSEVAYLSPGFNEVEKKSILRENDVLLNIVGASIGRAAIATKDVINGNVNQAVGVIRLLSLDLSNAFTLYYFLSDMAQSRIHSEKVDVARANFSLEDIRAMPFPLPPSTEQYRIAAEVDRRLSLVRETEAQVEANLKRAERLRQSVLQKAFSGELVRDEAG